MQYFPRAEAADRARHERPQPSIHGTGTGRDSPGKPRPATYHAVIGNCGTLLSFRIGLEDAELLAPAFSKHPGQLTPADLSNLPNYTAYARLLIDGHPSKPLSLRTLPPDATNFDAQRAEIVRRNSRHRYAYPAAQEKTQVRETFAFA